MGASIPRTSSFEGEPTNPPNSGVIDHLRPDLQVASSYIAGEVMGPFTLASQECVGVRSVRTSRQGKGLLQHLIKLVDATAGVAINQTEIDAADEEAYVNDLLRKHIGVGLDEEILSSLPLAVLSAMEVTRSLRQYSGIIIPQLRTETAPDQYELLKLLARPAVDPGSLRATSQEREIDALQFVYFFNLLDGERSAPSPNVVEGLSSGEFDPYIAKDILETAAYAPESRNGLAEVQKMVHLGMHLTDHEDMATVIEGLAHPKAHDHWPIPAKRALDTQHANYVHRLGENSSLIRSYLESNNYIVSDSTEELLEKAANKLMLEIAKQRSVNTSLSMVQRMAARAVLESTKRRNLPRSTTPEVGKAALTLVSTPEAQPKVPNKLVYVKSTGEEYPEGSPEFEDCFNDFLRQNLGRKGLKEDLESIKDFLKRLDLSAGLPRGVHVPKGGRNIRRGTQRFSRIFELEVFKATNLPTSSERGEVLRAFFTMKSGTVYFLGVDDKDNFARLSRRAGIRGRAHSK